MKTHINVQNIKMKKNAKNVDMIAARRTSCFPSAPLLALVRSFGSSAVLAERRVLSSQRWRHICAGRSGCSASIPAFMIARRCESRNTLYCTQTQKLMKVDCLPGHKFLNVCVHEWGKETHGRERWRGGESYLKQIVGTEVVQEKNHRLVFSPQLILCSSSCFNNISGPPSLWPAVFLFQTLSLGLYSWTHFRWVILHGGWGAVRS